MKLVSTIIDEIKEEFEGGNSLSVDWDIVIRKAVQTTLENINPTTLKKNVPIYGGFLRDVYVYYCPANVRVPVRLETNDKVNSFSYVPAKVFYAERNVNTFTIETVNGYAFLVSFMKLNDSFETIDEMDSATTLTGTATPVANDQNYLSGTGSISGTFTDTGKTIARTLATALNLSDYDRGTIIVPSFFNTAKNISSISLKLLTDSSNYYTVSSTVDSIGSTFIDGWNRVRFLVKNLSPTLSPTLANITAWEVTITTTTGATETVLIDNITIHKSAPFYLEYYSGLPFVDGVSGAWKNTCDYNNGDYLNMADDECAIVLYEACLLIPTSPKGRVDFKTQNLMGQLKRKYKNYFADNPSDAEPYTYNVTENIDMSLDGSVNNIPSKL